MSGLAAFVADHFSPGSVTAFVGAGGKSAGIRAVAELCAARGIRVLVTTTTRIATDDFPLFPVFPVTSGAGLRAAMDTPDPVRVVVSAGPGPDGKLIGIDASMIDDAPRPRDSVILVEADGSRRRPLKVPTARDPVIPASTGLVLGTMGATGFGKPVTEDICYNAAGALAILGTESGSFDAPSLVRIAAHADGLRKGVLPGMAFHVIVNQGDVAATREQARQTVAALRDSGLDATLLSWREGVTYDPA